MMSVSYRVRWTTRAASGAFDPRIPHEGHMIGILPSRAMFQADDGTVDYGLNDRAVIIERDPPTEIPGTRFKVVDLCDLSIVGLWKSDDTEQQQYDEDHPYARFARRGP